MSCLWHQGSPAGQEARLQPSSHLVQPLHIKFKRCETAAWGTGEADPTTDVVWGLDSALGKTFCCPFIFWLLAFSL